MIIVMLKQNEIMIYAVPYWVSIAAVVQAQPTDVELHAGARVATERLNQLGLRVLPDGVSIW